ncbi:ferritin [Leekyejoonella antrihumi]|uniref:Ferritin n=1 Tax=Leekyejoonella antrihumi TaxID=1660198 RepID=A0A563E112_9MICO|nr:ferritin [Leekyejoonella antrihumi]TWP36228.1 ferritin [Leekyejoonella antrihumi]
MKMTDSLEKSFNKQITLEFEASIVYRQLAIEMEDMDLPGMAAWLRHQADEEIVHANKFIDHLSDRGNHPVIGNVPAAKLKVTSVQDCFASALSHESRVSEAIRELYREADSAGDLDSRPLLTWFLSEQVEEEATVDEILGRIKLIDNDGPGLLRLDDEMATRPVATTENTGGA